MVSAILQPEQSPEQYLSFQLGQEIFALNILPIREIIEYETPTMVPMMPDFIHGVMNLRGTVVPVIDLSLRFLRSRSTPGRRSCIVVIEQDMPDDKKNQLIGIMVDAVHEVLSIAPSEIEPCPQFGNNLRPDFIQGMANYNNRFIILIELANVLSVDEISAISALKSQQGETLSSSEVA